MAREEIVTNLALFKKLEWSWFRSIAAFGDQEYYIIYPARYNRRLAGLRFLGGLAPYCPVDSTEQNPNDLLITIQFANMVPSDQYGHCLDLIRRWMRIADQWPRPLRNAVEIRSKCVSFGEDTASCRVDVAKGGQDALNLLSLLLFNFGEHQVPVLRPIFGHDNRLAEMLGKRIQNTAEVEI